MTALGGNGQYLKTYLLFKGDIICLDKRVTLTLFEEESVVTFYSEVTLLVNSRHEWVDL